jgi:hypothetical protein
MWWIKHVAGKGEMRNVHRILVRKYQKRPHERPGCRWKQNSKNYLQETACEDRIWIQLA